MPIGDELLMGLLSNLAAKKYYKDPINPNYVEGGAEGPLKRPGWFMSTVNPGLAANIYNTNQEFLTAPLRAKQDFDIRLGQLPVWSAAQRVEHGKDVAEDRQRQLVWRQEDKPWELGMAADILRQNQAISGPYQLSQSQALANQGFENEKRWFPDRLNMRGQELKQTSEAQTESMKALSKARIDELETQAALLREEGAIPQQLLKFSNRALALMMGEHLSNANMEQEATSRAAIGMGNPESRAAIQSYENVHGSNPALLPTQPKVVTLKDGKAYVDTNPGYDDPMKAALEMTGEQPPHVAAGAQLFPKLPRSVPVAGRPIVGTAQVTPPVTPTEAVVVDTPSTPSPVAAPQLTDFERSVMGIQRQDTEKARRKKMLRENRRPIDLSDIADTVAEIVARKQEEHKNLVPYFYR